MIYLKINGLILAKERIKENDAFLYILTKNDGILKCFVKSAFKFQSKNLTLLEPGNLCRFFIITNFTTFQVISALPLKTPAKTFHKHPYIFLWTLKLIKNTKLIETPQFIWFILTHLENYIQQNAKNFSYWFLFHLLRELGYEIELDKCYQCHKKLKNIAFFDRKKSLYCYNCKKNTYTKIKNIAEAQKIKSLAKVPNQIPEFIKIILKKYYVII
jgi:DNA repair protein RecO